jgi:dihydropyrimidinase
MRCDVGVVGEKIVELGQSLADGFNEVDATNCFVLPGGIDSHCHIEHKSSAGIECADDFYTATMSAAFGGTTTVIPFAAQHRGQSVQSVVDAYHASAGPKAVVDHAFYLIVTNPTPEVLENELPWLFNNGYTSVKVYITYDLLKLSDDKILTVLQVARREGAMVMAHAENDEVISWLTQRLLEAGHVGPVITP